MNIKKEAIAGLKWTTVSTVILSLAAIIKISLLARYLDKSDFGLMALVMFVLDFMNLFMDMGITTAIIHKQFIAKNEYSSLYWLNFMFSLILFIIIWFLSSRIASFYNERELGILIPIMASSLIISAVGRQFKTIRQKDMKFKTISIVDIATAPASVILAVYLALNNYGVYALVYSALFQYITSNIVFLIVGLNDIGLNFHFSFRETIPFLKIGMYQVGGQVINYFNRDIDTLIIGKLLGTEILGGYSLAKQLVFKPVQIINPIVTKIAGPLLANFQKDKVALKYYYLKLLNMVATINIPIYIFMAIFASFIVRILYGTGFQNIVSLVQILSIYMIFRAIGNPIGSLVTATGRTDIEFYWNMIILIITPIAVYLGSFISIEAVALSLLCSMIVMFIPSWKFLVNKLISVSLGSYIKSSLPNFKIYIDYVKNTVNSNKF